MCTTRCAPQISQCKLLTITVLADDNRPNMLVGVVVRTRAKRTGPTDPGYSSKKSKLSEEDEPYEPPGIDDIIPAEPETPSPLTTPKSVEPLLQTEGGIPCSLCIML